MVKVPILYPGKYAPGTAVNFADAEGNALQVSAAAPLPVTLASATAASASPAVSGSTSTPITAGPFAPATGKPVMLSLSGTWAGTVKVLRSVNNGATRLPLTLAGAPWGVYAGNVCEPVWEETEAGVTLYLQLTPSSGSITYRLAQ